MCGKLIEDSQKKFVRGRTLMLTFDEVLNLNYYRKTSYTGWINGMRFLIKGKPRRMGMKFSMHGYGLVR